MAFYRCLIVLYYLATIVAHAAIPEGVLSGYRPLFNERVLVFWGLVPLCVGVIAILVSSKRSNKINSWCLFGFGLTGVVLSFGPWRECLYALLLK